VLAINWDASSLAYPWVKKPMVRIGLYRTALDHGMQATGWAH